MNGMITAVIRKSAERAGGFGFIEDEEGRERFFHASNVRGIKFEDLRDGMNVVFTPIAIPGKGRDKTPGLRAEDVAVVK